MDEIWDLYDEHRHIIGTHIRGHELPKNGYHLVVHVWIKNSQNYYLISQRAASRKAFPLMWECVGGSVLKGETSLQGALREAKEEIGVDLPVDKGKLLFSLIRKTIDGKKFNDILDVYLFDCDCEVDLTKATTAEVAQTKWLSKDEITKLYYEQKMVRTLQYFFNEVAK
ncbi:MAG: NUDIX domain-containing protein [Alphaproteobacteria bacterium]|nr:NUDIX domain-containing protein [Alphaproteobacteria bacterium]